MVAIDSRAGERLAEDAEAEGFISAAARFDRAMGRLEASVRGLNGRVRAHARIEDDVRRLNGERARLAGELDKASAKARRLDASADEVARRLVDAMETVRQVLAK